MGRKRSDYYKNLIKAYGDYRETLCSRYNRKCLTNPTGKCPMAKFYCYEILSIGQLLSDYDPMTRKKILSELKRLAAEEGVKLP